MSELYDSYWVELEFTRPVLGTIPRDREVRTKFFRQQQEAKAKKAGLPGPGDDEVVPDSLEGEGHTTFFRDEKGRPCLFDYQIKGYLKEAGNVIKEVVGVKNLRSHINNHVFVDPRRILLYEETDLMAVERPLRAMTQKGPRVTLVSSDAVPEGTHIRFGLRVVKNSKVTEKVLAAVLEFGEHGIGMQQWRTGGWGQFIAKLHTGALPTN